MYFIECIEKAVGKKAKKNFTPLQPGDVPMTFADVTALEKTINFKAGTNIETGIKNFVEWYKDYYKA